MTLNELWNKALIVKNLAIVLLSNKDTECGLTVDALDDYLHEDRSDALADPTRKLLKAACDFVVLNDDDLTSIDILTYQNLLDEIEEMEK